MSDVIATKVTATGAVYAGRSRIKGLYYVGGVGAGSVVLSNGNGGATAFEIDTAASAYGYIQIPGQGISCSSSIYATLTGVTSITVIHG